MWAARSCRDKLFFFGNYEGTRKAEDQQVTSESASRDRLPDRQLISYPGRHAQSPAQVAALDAGCAGGVVQQLRSIRPVPGRIRTLSTYFNSMPAANGTLTGDGLNTRLLFVRVAEPADTEYVAASSTDSAESEAADLCPRPVAERHAPAPRNSFPGQAPVQRLRRQHQGHHRRRYLVHLPEHGERFRYGYIRQGYSYRGLQTTAIILDFRFMSTATAETATDDHIGPGEQHRGQLQLE